MSFTRQISDLNSEYNTIMKQNFNIHKFFTFTYHSRNYNGILFRANIRQGMASEPLTTKTGIGSCSFYYTNDFLNVANTLKTTGDVKIGLGFNHNKYVKNLSSNIKIRTNYYEDEFDGKVRFFLKKNRYNFKSVLDWSANKCLTASILGLLLSRPNEEIGFGAGLSFALEEKQFALYNLIMWYTKYDSKFIVRHTTSKNKFQPGKITAKVYNRINEKTDIALSAERDFTEQEQTIKLGARHRFSDTLTSKVKIDSGLNVETATELQVNPNVRLVFLTRANLGQKSTEKVSNIQNNLPFALKLTFAE